MRIRDESGQASVEFVALLPVVLLVLGLAWQTVVAGQAVWLAGGAARAAARAHALGLDAGAAARGVLPVRLREQTRVHALHDGSVAVILAVPAVIGGGSVATVSARARFTPQGR